MNLTTLSSPYLLASHTTAIPTGFWVLVSIVNKAHHAWKWYVWKETYSNPDHFLGLLAGNAADYCIDNRLIKLPAIPFFIISRFLDYFKQQDKCLKTWGKWKDSINGIHPINIKISHTGKTNVIFLKPYAVVWFISDSNRCYIRIYKIAVSTLQLSIESFKLLMHIMDLMDCFTVDPQKIQQLASQAFREGGVHGPKCLKVLCKNKTLFMHRLEMMDGFFQSIFAVNSFKHMRDSLSSFFDATESWLSWYDKVSNKTGRAITALGKKVIYDLAPEHLKSCVDVEIDLFLDPKPIKPCDKQLLKQTILLPAKKEEMESKKKDLIVLHSSFTSQGALCLPNAANKQLLPKQGKLSSKPIQLKFQLPVSLLYPQNNSH